MYLDKLLCLQKSHDSLKQGIVTPQVFFTSDIRWDALNHKQKNTENTGIGLNLAKLCV